jgi:hypothetical protein
MSDSTHKTVSVLPLDPGSSGLLDGIVEYMGSCAAVCLEKNAHASGVLMLLEGDYSTKFRLTWSVLSEKHHRTCADIQEATEFGAYGVAILMVRETTGKTVVQRAAKGPGFDFWVGDEEDLDLPFQGLTRLEVSGILQGNIGSIRARINQKKKQVTPSDDRGPAIIAVVDFGGPLTRMESK